MKMSFLEFVAERLMGQPVSGSCWNCPYCVSSGPSFSVRPPLGNYSIKFKCHRCGKWGDEMDLLKLFFPEDDYSVRLTRVQELRLDFERTTAPTTAAIPIRGEGGVRNMNQPRDVGLVWANVVHQLAQIEVGPIYGLQLLRIFIEGCESEKVTPRALLDYWIEYENWKSESLKQHAAECNDASCGDECRMARGMPPLATEDRLELG